MMPGELRTEIDPIPVSRLGAWKGQEQRVAALKARFRDAFKTEPSFFVRVPGRVNLIGEHVDYCGYGVFPMAIEQDVLVACHVLEDQASLQLINMCSQYGDFACSLKDMRELLRKRTPGVSPPWHLYFLCGVLGVLDHLGESVGSSMQICVDGRVPQRAGLSSSSALVCSAALTTLIAHKGVMGRKEMAALCAASERYIGTQGGGMDQAIAFMATAGTAQRIEFLPALSGEKVVLPSSAVFVIANSLVEANKAASDGYNIRVAECRLATWILGKKAGLDFQKLEKIKELQLALGVGTDEMLDLVDKQIHEEPYSALEVAGTLDMDLSDLVEKPLMNRIPLKSIQLKLYHRITHVLREAARVEDFHRVCKAGGEKRETLVQLGKLMNASHQSLRDSYECSHPRLDTLVALAQSQAYGARLSGAGWGGCMVALCDQSQIQSFMETLQNEYYKEEELSSHVFVTQPGAGACILEH